MEPLSFFALAAPAFLAGVLTILAPCTFPLIPAYLSFISGGSRLAVSRRKIFLNAAAFVIGFTAIFIVFGILLAFVGSIVLGPWRIWLARAGGVLVIAFGLFMLGIIKVPFLAREIKFEAPKIFSPGNPFNSFILGAAFSLGWTPCVGPILGSVLLLASTKASVVQGGILLAIFSAGFAVPLLAIAFGIGSASRLIERITPWLHWVEVFGGLMLVGLGVLLVTDNLPLLIPWGFHFFRFIDYDRILNFL